MSTAAPHQPRPAALAVIRDEHEALAAMLRSLAALLEQSRREAALPDFRMLRAMLFYLDEYPEKRHHRKESGLLFPKLRRRAPALGVLLDRLDQEHGRGESAIRELEHALLAFEVLGESRRRAFEEAVQQYAAFYLEHMAVEERDILPAALRLLAAEDWAELDAAFAAHRDPLTGHLPDDEYRNLFRLIVMSAPAPIGLGAAH